MVDFQSHNILPTGSTDDDLKTKTQTANNQVNGTINATWYLTYVTYLRKVIIANYKERTRFRACFDHLPCC